MHLAGIEIDNFLRIGRLRLDLTPTIMHIICGPNESGKTSLQEAIRFCLLGETERVSMKRDYKLMIKDGAQAGEVRVRLDDDAVLARDVATGRGTAEDYANIPETVKYLLDATRYPWLNDKQRRAFMFNLMHIRVKADDIKRRLMEDKGVDEAMADVIMPMLKAGFDAAHSFAKDKATEARGEWKGTTGEQYGAKKAETWEPGDEQAGTSAADLTEALADLAKVKKAYETAAIKHGTDTEHKSVVNGQTFPCPSCGETICLDNLHSRPVRIVTKEEMAVKPGQDKQPEDRSKLDAAAEALEAAELKVASIRVSNERFKNSKTVIAQADKLHEQIGKWVKATDALAPTGIPAEMISEKIKPLNDRLRETAVMTGWPQVSCTADMQILVDNRLYSLQSESSQWRTQAAIVEAISFMSELGIIVLDRVDVLDLKNRTALIKWLLKVQTEHRNVLLFGTFKEPPKVPSAISVHWLEGGKIIAQEKAA